MKITAPLSNVQEVETLIKAGADEFYCGLFSEELKQKYQLYNINDRSLPNSNFTNFEDLKHSIEIASSYDVPIYLTLNNVYYIDGQIETVKSYIEKAIKLGISGFIVTDLGIISYLNALNSGLRVHVSTINSVLNSNACLFYKEYNVKRVILERQITIDEIRSIKNSIHGIELEAFVFNIKCINMEGLCNCQHNLDIFSDNHLSKITKKISKYSNRLNILKKIPSPLLNFMKNKAGNEVPPCMSNYDVELFSIDAASDSANNLKKVKKNIDQRVNNVFKMKIQQSDCGLCGLYEFRKMGLDAVKIAGRRFPIQRKLRDLRLVKNSLNVAEMGYDKDTTISLIRKQFCNAEGIDICNKSNCFFPMD